MRRLIFAFLALAACKRPDDSNGPITVAPVPTTPAPIPSPPPPSDLPPPSEELSPPPAELAQHVRLVPFASGFDKPVALVAPPGDPRRRLFVVEQVGTIRVLVDGKALPGAFLDLRRGVSDGGEQGLLGLAFHPKFVENRRFYVNYTDRRGDTHVVEYQASAADPDRADPATARELLVVDQPYSNHNGGHVTFGPDGKLWVGLGDGGSAGDPREAGQDDAVLLAKMLRLDVDTPGAKAEIVAKGLRNPWRYAFDPATGDLYIGDVGQNAWEQIYAVPAARLTGHNFGWNVAEGRHCYARRGCDRTPFTPPVADYDHATGCSVTGGVVYRGKALPALDGVYFYADYCTAIIRSFRWRPDGIRQHWEWKPVLDPDSRLGQVASFGVDHDGEMYLLLLGGDLLRLAPH